MNTLTEVLVEYAMHNELCTDQYTVPACTCVHNTIEPHFFWVSTWHMLPIPASCRYFVILPHLHFCCPMKLEADACIHAWRYKLLHQLLQRDPCISRSGQWWWLYIPACCCCIILNTNSIAPIKLILLLTVVNCNCFLYNFCKFVLVICFIV